MYAGLPDNWGASFLVGQVPVFKYLESQDVDEVGYTLRTASLMTDPEYHFDQSDPGDYAVFGVRYLLLPSGTPPPVPARLVMVRTPYALWEVPSVGYLSVARSVGTVVEDRADVGRASVPFLRSALPGAGRTLLVDWDGVRSATTTRPPGSGPPVAGGPPGRVVVQQARLAQGAAGATVRMARSGLVVLSASFDPGWQAQVDGRPVATVMVAPALVAVPVGPGTHRVEFRYVGYAGYPLLLVLSALTMIGALVGDRWWASRPRPPSGRPRLARRRRGSGGSRSGAGAGSPCGPRAGGRRGGSGPAGGLPAGGRPARGRPAGPGAGRTSARSHRRSRRRTHLRSLRPTPRRHRNCPSRSSPSSRHRPRPPGNRSPSCHCHWSPPPHLPPHLPPFPRWSRTSRIRR